MFKNPVAINSEQHNRLRFIPADNFSFARGLSHAPVLAFEFEKMAAHYPVVFEPRTGQPMAILGLTPGQNAFLDNSDKWCAPVIPAVCGSYPFGLYHSENGQYVVIMDEDAENLGDKGKLLYNKQGDSFRVSPLFKEIKAGLQALEEQRHITHLAFTAVAKSGVLIPQKAEFTLGEAKRKLRGFSVVDWSKVKKLDTETQAQWQASGIMAMLKAHTASLENLKVVHKLQQQHLPD